MRFLRLILATAVFTAFALIVSYGDARIEEFDQMVVYHRCGKDGAPPPLFDTLEMVTETATQIVLCRVERQNRVFYEPDNLLHFNYEIELLDILLDSSGELEVGDRIDVMSDEGIIRACDLPMYARADSSMVTLILELYIEKTEFEDNVYFTSSVYDAIPIEVGRTYIMFINDEGLIYSDKYLELGHRFLFEYVGDRVYWRAGVERHELSRDELIEEIKAQIERRSGEIDELGYFGFMRSEHERNNEAEASE